MYARGYLPTDRMHAVERAQGLRPYRASKPPQISPSVHHASCTLEALSRAPLSGQALHGTQLILALPPLLDLLLYARADKEEAGLGRRARLVHAVGQIGDHCPQQVGLLLERR